MNKIDKHTREEVLISTPGQLLLIATNRTTWTSNDIT